MTKRVIIIAGPNGSGKTTFARKYLETYPYEYISADEIAEEIDRDRFVEVRLQAVACFSTE